MAQKLKARKLIFILVVVSFCILTIPTVIYLGNFGAYKISDSPGDWGVFGDYIGGVLNPLLSIVNLIVLGYLTIFVSEQDSRTALNQFRFDLYMKLMNTIDQFEVDESTDTGLDQLSNMANSIFDYSFLFKEVESEYQDKATAFRDAILRFYDYYDNSILATSSDDFEISEGPDFALLENEYEKNKTEFLRLLQKSMINPH